MKSLPLLGLAFILITFYTVLQMENEKLHHHFNWSGIRTEIRDSIILIAEHGNLDGGMRGQPGHVTRQYKRILWLKNTIQTEEAVLLSKYPSVPIKALIFEVLLYRMNHKAVDMVYENINDTAFIYYGSGCVYQKDKLNYYLWNNLVMAKEWLPITDEFVSDSALTKLKEALN